VIHRRSVSPEIEVADQTAAGDTAEEAKHDIQGLVHLGGCENAIRTCQKAADGRDVQDGPTAQRQLARGVLRAPAFCSSAKGHGRRCAGTKFDKELLSTKSHRAALLSRDRDHRAPEEAWLRSHTADRSALKGRLNGRPDVAQVVEYSEDVEQPQDYNYHHHDVEDPFDLPIHGDVAVDEPEQDSDYDETDDDCN